MDAVQIVLFKMLPRKAQIEKVRAEINRSLLKPYGRLTRLDIDPANRIIRADVVLKGENESVHITLSRYQLMQEAGKNPLFAPGTISVSREWLDALLRTLMNRKSWPQRMEIKNPLHQTVLKSIL